MRLYQRILAFGSLLILNTGFFLLLSSLGKLETEIHEYGSQSGGASDMESLMDSLAPIDEALNGIRRSSQMGFGFVTLSVAMAAIAFFGPGYEVPRREDAIEK